LHPPAKGSSALMAVDDVTVALDVLGRGLVFKVADARR